MAAKKATTAARERRMMKARETFIEKLFANAQAQIDDITRRVEAGTRNGAESERDARAVAALVKVLCAMGGNGEDKREDTADDDEGPHDLDEFRRELGRQMDEITARRTGRDSGESSAADD